MGNLPPENLAARAPPLLMPQAIPAMKLAKILLLSGGVVNALFVLFHVWLGWQIHHLPGLAPDVRALLTMLNRGETLFILLIAAASLTLPSEILVTRLGRGLLWFVAALYFSRTAAEAVVAPRFSVAIFATCFAVGAIYVAVALLSGRATPTRSVDALPAK